MPHYIANIYFATVRSTIHASPRERKVFCCGKIISHRVNGRCAVTTGARQRRELPSRRTIAYSASGCLAGSAASNSGKTSQAATIALRRGIAEVSTLNRLAENICGIR